MRKVFRYTLDDGGELQMPVGAQILAVHEQFDVLCLWALVDTGAETERRRFVVAGTGHELPAYDLKYIGSGHLHGGRFVLHAFEIIGG